MRKYLIINADDFGASVGVNRGIFESHTCGVVTSTSLMVTGRAACEAVAISRDCPGLSRSALGRLGRRRLQGWSYEYPCSDPRGIPAPA